MARGGLARGGLAPASSAMAEAENTQRALPPTTATTTATTTAWNTSWFGWRVAADVASAGAAGILTCPLITMIDRQVACV